MVVGGLLIIFTNPDRLYAWARFFNDPLRALSRSWEAVSSAYAALFHGGVRQPPGHLPRRSPWPPR